MFKLTEQLRAKNMHISSYCSCMHCDFSVQISSSSCLSSSRRAFSWRSNCACRASKCASILPFTATAAPASNNQYINTMPRQQYYSTIRSNNRPMAEDCPPRDLGLTASAMQVPVTATQLASTLRATSWIAREAHSSPLRRPTIVFVLETTASAILTLQKA